MEHITIDQRQEDYFNDSSDNEDEPPGLDEKHTPNGTSNPRPLVDYPSDEEGDENADPEASSSAAQDSDKKTGSKDVVDGDDKSGTRRDPPRAN